MSAGPTITKTIGQKGLERGVAGQTVPSPPSRLSRRETILLRTALGIALLAAGISILARIAPTSPTAASILAVGLFIFGIGGILGAGINAMMRPAIAAANGQSLALADSLAAILDAAPIGIAVWDAQDNLVQVNPAYTDYLELATPDIIIGSPRTKIRAMGGRALEGIIRPDLHEVRNNRGRFSLERIAAPDGTTIEILNETSQREDNSEAATEAEARIRHLIGEVSRLSILNEDLQNEIGTLEGTINLERTRANTATQAKSEFLSHMSHELRTPLNAILGFADMMRSGVFGPLGHEKYNEYADDIHTSGKQLLAMITDILDVSQIQSGDVPIERQRIDLEKTITDCLTLLRPRIFASGIALTEILDGLPSVYADPLAVRQILLHILSNAMKFTPTGGRISIKAEIEEECVTLIIDDTGIGISPEILERIDQPFSALEQDALISGDEGAGLGVGLSVSRALARLNGGAIVLESEEGYGTTVRITLPRR